LWGKLEAKDARGRDFHITPLTNDCISSDIAIFFWHGDDELSIDKLLHIYFALALLTKILWDGHLARSDYAS
jgi:hypothetical protein